MNERRKTENTNSKSRKTNSSRKVSSENRTSVHNQKPKNQGKRSLRSVSSSSSTKLYNGRHALAERKAVGIDPPKVLGVREIDFKDDRRGIKSTPGFLSERNQIKER